MTIDKKSSGETKGRQGSSSKNIDVLGREILTPDEVRMLDNKKCLVFIRGLNPVMDSKYFTPKHPRFTQSADGEGEPFHFVPRLPDNLLAPPYAILTPEGLVQYEKRKLNGEAVYIDSLTYDEFMMLDDVGVTKRFMEMDRTEAEQEYRENEQTGELAYTPDEETEKNLVAELIALKKKANAKVGQTEGNGQEGGTVDGGGRPKSDAGGSNDDDGSGSGNGTDGHSGDTVSGRLEHLKFTPAQKSEIKRALDEKLPEDYILSYALPENSVVKMASMRKKYAGHKQNNKGKGESEL